MTDALQELRPQYHFRKTSAGFDIWSVKRLIELAKDFEVFGVAPSTFEELNKNHWYKFEDDVPTPMSLISLSIKK